MLGAASKALATIATQPLIVAKVGLQSRPPPERNGKPFSSFVEVMQFIIEREGVLGLFKGIAPQILKGFLVQGILMMTKERYASTASVSLRMMLTAWQHGTIVCSLHPLPQEPPNEAVAKDCREGECRWQHSPDQAPRNKVKEHRQGKKVKPGTLSYTYTNTDERERER